MLTAPTPDRTAARAALARCVGDVDDFLASRFGLASHRHDGGGDAGDLLGLADVDAQLAGGALRRPVVRLVRDGSPVDPATWTRRARVGGRWVDDLVDSPRLLAQVGAGATVVLQSLQRWWPPLARFCDDLSAAVGHPTQANAYLTPPGAAGLAPHHDTHDVFVLQVHGTKHWTVRAPLVEAPLPRHRSDHDEAAAQPVLLETDLTPGTCLYLPRGFVHSAAAQEGMSLHLTIGVLATTAHDLAVSLVQRAADDVRFRRALPPGHASSAAAAAQAVKAVVADLQAWLDDLDLDEEAERLVDRAVLRRLAPAGGHLLSLAALGTLGDGTAVVAAPGLAWREELEGERLVLRLAGRTITLPAGVREPVARLLAGAPLAVGDLAGALDEESRLVLVRRLAREGLLRVVDGD